MFRPPPWSPNRRPFSFFILLATTFFTLLYAFKKGEAAQALGSGEMSGCQIGAVPSALNIDGEGRPVCPTFTKHIPLDRAGQDALDDILFVMDSSTSTSSLAFSTHSSMPLAFINTTLAPYSTILSSKKQQLESTMTTAKMRFGGPKEEELATKVPTEEREEEWRRAKRSTPMLQQDSSIITTKMMPTPVRCSATFSDIVCDMPNEWTGAINEVNNGTHISLFMQCCTVNALAQWAAPLKRIVLGQGEHFDGGPVLHNGEMVAFDLIKEIRKNVTAENQVLYVLSVHRALCLAPVLAIPPRPSTPSSSNRLSKFGRLYAAGARSSEGGGAPPLLNTSRQYLPYSLVRKAVAIQKQREQRLMAINRRRHPPRKSFSSNEQIEAAAVLAEQMVDGQPERTSSLNSMGKSSRERQQQQMRNGSYEEMGMMRGEQQQRTMGAIYGRRRPYRPWLISQKQQISDTDYYEEDGASDGNGIPVWLLHRRRTPWSRLRRIGGGRRRTRPASISTADSQKGEKTMGNSGNRILTSSIHQRHLADGRGQIGGGKMGIGNGGNAKEIMAVHNKPRHYSDGVGQQPDTQIPIRTNSDEEYQSVVEQEMGMGGGPEISQEEGGTVVVPSEAAEQAATAAETAENFVTLIPQRDQQQQTSGTIIVPAPPPQQSSFVAPAPVNPYIPAAPNLLPINGGGCGGGNGGNCPASPPTKAASVVTYGGEGGCRAGGGSGGCGGAGGGCASGNCGAPQSIQLACGSCSCSSCQCSSLPEPCSGSSCPTCPSVCNCPSECGCIEAQAKAAEQEAYRQEYNQLYQQYGQSAAQGQIGGNGAAATGLNGAFAAVQCFSADQIVQTTRGQIRMDELRVGDLVLSVEESLISYSPVLMFLHRRPTEHAKFRLVYTESGNQLKLTDFHLVWAGCGQLRLIRAKDLEVGQCLFAVDNHNDVDKLEENGRRRRTRLVSTKISKIEEIEEDGIYAPLTANGNLVVNGVLVSCHSNFAAQTLQQTFFRWWRSLHWLLANKWPPTLYLPWLREREGEQEEDQLNGSGELPTGVHFLTTILDTLIPKSLIDD